VKIETTRFGAVEVDEKRIIEMPYGMLGFQDRKRFVIFPHREDSPFYWYQSVDDPSLAFVVTSAFLVFPEYQVDLKDALKKMAWEDHGSETPLELYVVVNIPKGSPEKMTANLIGPILINIRNSQAVQLVLADSPYSHRYPILRQN
jgi:flagellar assembly factor FliW